MTCEEVRVKWGVEKHCYSCHDEADEGYGALCEVEIDGQTVGVCCVVAGHDPEVA